MIAPFFRGLNSGAFASLLLSDKMRMYIEGCLAQNHQNVSTILNIDSVSAAIYDPKCGRLSGVLILKNRG